MGALVHVVLSHDEARVLTDEVRGDAERLWRKLVELYEGGAHSALGYSSWAAYFKAEFGGSRSASHRILDAGRVARMLDSPNGGVIEPTSERVARALVPLKNDPEQLRDAWEAAMERGNGRPTSALVGEVVAERMPPTSRKAKLNLNAAKRRLYDGLSSVSGYCTALTDESTLHRALTGASPDDIAAWERLASESVRALNELRRAVKESK